jgi:hypothetical protein
VHITKSRISKLSTDGTAKPRDSAPASVGAFFVVLPQLTFF